MYRVYWKESNGPRMSLVASEYALNTFSLSCKHFCLFAISSNRTSFSDRFLTGFADAAAESVAV